MKKKYFNSFDNLRIFYETNLNGNLEKMLKTPITFIHGQSGGNSTLLSFQINHLKQKYPVLSFDMRGCGRSELKNRKEYFELEKVAKDTINLWEHENIEKSHLLGYSLGTTVSLKVFDLAPEKIKSLILLHPTYNPLKTTSKFNKFLVHSRIEKYLGGLINYVFYFNNKFFRNNEQKEVYDFGKDNDVEGIKMYFNRGFLKKQTPEQIISRMKFTEARKKWDVEYVLDKINIPTLCIAAEKDMWTPPSVSQEIFNRVDNEEKELKIIPENRHNSVYKNPDKINECISSFLEKIE